MICYNIREHNQLIIEYVPLFLLSIYLRSGLMCSEAINNRVAGLKDNESEINRFVEEYKPFIAACAEKTAGRYMRYGEDDELSVAMLGFVEAIHSFDHTKGHFISFAQNVIKRRLIDHYRKEKRHSGVISLSGYIAGQDEGFDLSEVESIEQYSEDRINELRRFELDELKEELSHWGISMMDLVDVSPKQEKTRKACREITGLILSRSDMLRQIMEKRYLPVSDIEKALRIPRKIIERSRKYIIAVIIIAIGDYQYIRDYVKFD